MDIYIIYHNKDEKKYKRLRDVILKLHLSEEKLYILEKLLERSIIKTKEGNYLWKDEHIDYNLLKEMMNFNYIEEKLQGYLITYKKEGFNIFNKIRTNYLKIK